MSEGLNKVLLLGNLGADPELKILQGGQAVMRFRLATTETYLDRTNTRKERTEWHSCVLWGKRAEALAKFLAKGARIFVEGKLQTSSWEKDGEKRYRTEVVATNILFANARGETERTAERGTGTGGGGSEPRAPGRTGGGREAPTPSGQGDFGDYGSYDDIPFVADTTLFGRWDRP